MKTKIKMGFNSQKIVFAIIAFTVTISLSTCSIYRIRPDGSSARGWFKNAAVAADSDVCSKIAVNILRKNGSVVDAGIAAQLCNGVLDQPHMGIGGSSVSAIYATPRFGTKKELVYISGDDRAPRWIKKDSFSGVPGWSIPYKIITEDGEFPKMFTFRDLCVGIPGELAGYYRAWQRFGNLPWKEVVQPSIDLARNGFPITKAVEHVVTLYTTVILGDESLNNFFSAKDGGLYSIGDIITDDKLGKTLETIAEDPVSFYKGQLADDIISDLNEYGSKLVKEDLEDYEPRELEPFEFSMMDGKYKAYVPGNPFGGQLFILAYNILEGYNMTSETVSTQEGMVLFYHRFIETWKFTYSHTGCIGDSEESSTKCQYYLKQIITTEYADYVRSLINDGHAHSDPDMYKLMDHPISPDLQGTSHLSIIGEDGSAFLSTSSINTEFGWRHKGTKTGILFNNRLNDFTRVLDKDQQHPKDEINYLSPGKQARSFRMPLLVLDESGNAVMGIGASGGSRIMMSLMQDVFMHLKFGLKLKDAIDYPRIVMFRNEIYYDNMDKEIIDGLKTKSHHMRPVQPTMPYTSVAQGVSRFACKECLGSGTKCNTPCIEAVSDFRKGGVPDGY